MPFENIAIEVMKDNERCLVFAETFSMLETTLAQPTIRVLPPAVTARIAAGEVIERPASVVKELVENALDAGAKRISVEISKGGVDLIRVSDDGVGMDEADLSLCVLEHATSKLT